MKEDMAPVFEPVMNSILHTMNAEDDHEEIKDESKKDKNGFSLDSDSEQDYVGLNVNLK